MATEKRHLAEELNNLREELRHKQAELDLARQGFNKERSLQEAKLRDMEDELQNQKLTVESLHDVNKNNVRIIEQQQQTYDEESHKMRQNYENRINAYNAENREIRDRLQHVEETARRQKEVCVCRRLRLPFILILIFALCLASG